MSTEERICKLRNLLDSDTPSGDVTNYTLNPIFYLERDMPMRALLRDLGIQELLKPDAINLDDFFVDDESVHLGNAVHRISVSVTEEDTEACAANVIYTGQKTSRGPQYNYLNYNFPFVWLIYDKQRRNVLFVGAFNKFEK
ncbi:antithrombin-iii-like isoform 2 protein [Lasius niger]|uniref:Antithrombin-iii-like isoform 2 protein n=1 Tax=Lasius niger TaxID=67767 RepID=A0A0J7K722_LASNI|nr:antithrombin-iii-like isoform 2 protein [Lasius niger]